MPKKLTVEEIKNFKQDIKKIYEEAKLPEVLHDKMIENDIQVLNSMLEWIEKFEKNSVLDTFFDYVNYYVNELKNLDEKYRAMGCSDEMIKTIVSYKDKISEIPLVKEIKNKLFELTKLNTAPQNFDDIIKMIVILQNLESLFNDPFILSLSEDHKEILAELKELNQALKDGNIIKILTEQQSVIEKITHIQQDVLDFKDDNLVNMMEFMAKKEEELDTIQAGLEKIENSLTSINTTFSKLKLFKLKTSAENLQSPDTEKSFAPSI